MTHSLFHILNISRQDMMSRMTDLDVSSNNIANINTAGYKSSRSNFQELLTTKELEGVHLSSTQMMTGQGNLKTTENPLDLAIEGDGYFSVKLADGKTGYTRDGQFIQDSAGKLVTSSGAVLNWSGTIPADVEEIQIDKNGAVQTRVGETWTTAGNISLTRFTNPSGLTTYGNNIFLESTSSGTAQTGTPGATNFGTIASQSVEMSNVNLANEFTHLMTVQRNFQMSTRTFQQTDEMINEAIHMRKY
jgi:flagellar basal-body rod protein FlgG